MELNSDYEYDFTQPKIQAPAPVQAPTVPIVSNPDIPAPASTIAAQVVPAAQQQTLSIPALQSPQRKWWKSGFIIGILIGAILGCFIAYKFIIPNVPTAIHSVNKIKSKLMRRPSSSNVREIKQQQEEENEQTDIPPGCGRRFTPISEL